MPWLNVQTEMCQAPGTATEMFWGQLHGTTLCSPVKGASDKVVYWRGFRASPLASVHHLVRFPHLTTKWGHGEHPGHAKAIPHTNPGCAL